MEAMLTMHAGLLRDHVPGAGLADQERAFEPDIHGGVPGRFRQRLQFARHDLHGVVDDDVDAAELLNHRVMTMRAMSADLATSATTAKSRPTSLAVAAAVAGSTSLIDDIGALAGIGERDVAADAAPRPGDERHLVLQPHGIPPLNCIFLRKNNAKAAGQSATRGPSPLEIASRECHLRPEESPITWPNPNAARPHD